MLKIQRKTVISGGLIGGAVSALAMAVATLPADEGTRYIGYRDIGGVATDCTGHTGPDVRVGGRKTPAQCATELEGDARHAEAGVLRCSPTLADRPYQLAAATRFSFNVGVTSYCRSSIARAFSARNWRGGCDALLAYRFVGRREIPGLLARRRRERAMCLAGL